MDIFSKAVNGIRHGAIHLKDIAAALRITKETPGRANSRCLALLKLRKMLCACKRNTEVGTKIVNAYTYGRANLCLSNNSEHDSGIDGERS